MKIPAIKKIVEAHTINELIEAQTAIIDEQPLQIEIEGDDDGEKLTHVMAAIWIMNAMQDHQLDFNSALREYTKKVRASIS